MGNNTSIQKYLNDELSDAEEEILLGHLLKAQQKQAFKAHWRQTLREETPKQNISFWKRYQSLGVAAAMLVVLVGAWWIWSIEKPTVSNMALKEWQASKVDSYHVRSSEHAPVDASVVGLSKAAELYQQQKFAQTIEVLLPFVGDNEQAMMLTAMAYVELKEYDRAIGLFSQIKDSPTALNSDEAQWRLALTYLLAQKNAEARVLLRSMVDKKAWNYEKAAVLLNELEQ